MQTTVMSFGYKHGLPLDVDMVFDCRFLPNPHWVERAAAADRARRARARLRARPAGHGAFLDQHRRPARVLLPAYVDRGQGYLAIGVGCTGGHHRSVVIAEEIARRIRGLGYSTKVSHRDIDR